VESVGSSIPAYLSRRLVKRARVSASAGRSISVADTPRPEEPRSFHLVVVSLQRERPHRLRPCRLAAPTPRAGNAPAAGAARAASRGNATDSLRGAESLRSLSGGAASRRAPTAPRSGRATDAADAVGVSAFPRPVSKRVSEECPKKERPAEAALSDQFSVGRSIRSTTRIGSTDFSGCSFSPSCSCSAVKISGASSTGGGSAPGRARGVEYFSVSA
jgi:hypothetical protein